MLKGVTRVDDAKRAVDAGVTAISVSNHGGNNLDGTPATIRLLPDIADRARQVREDPAPVMPAQRRRQRRRQPGRQAGPVRQLPQQHQASMRHDARAAARDFKTARPSGSVHVEGAPQTRRIRTSAILILPVQEHFLVQAHRSETRPIMKRQG